VAQDGHLICDQFEGFFKVYVADEVYKTQAGSTDVGAADGRLITGTKYSIALPATLFGGVASSFVLPDLSALQVRAETLRL
jgi:hypothetical protein